ncbi:MAG TPA: FadR/GntR family transcriptional regulator [Solirubrobacterales bacterium]|nr:FadR/GntR family transcriptional regulator [Solirubrobacterales bacterium]
MSAADSDGGGLRAARVRTAPEQIVASIRDSILEGSLGPGDRLPSEQTMAEMFGVSRPTVREALRTLRADHVLVSARGRTGGYRVAELSLQALGASVGEVISLSLGMKTLDYGQLFAVRFDLELRSAATAAQVRTDADLELLREALPAEPGELGAEAALGADVGFHRALAEASHNPLLVGFAGATATAFRRFSEEVQEVDPGQVLSHLDEVVDAVAASDPDAAREAMRRHLGYFSRYFELE